MTQTTIKHYAELYVRHLIIPDKSVSEVPSRDSSKIEIPENVFAYRFFDRQVTQAEDGEVLLGKPRNYSEAFFTGIGGWP